MTALHFSLGLDGAGWHPHAWRAIDRPAADLFGAPYWLELATLAHDAAVDFITIADTFAAGQGADAARIDAVLLASRIAPVTRRIGLLPEVTLTHTEPFHISKAIATLDFVSQGRGGLLARITDSESEAKVFGRKGIEPRDALLAEAADAVEVIRRLWDSWEDDAEIRDVATGRFVDRDKLHYIDFEGEHFSVRGPSITPRPPQGQPVVAVPRIAGARWEADIEFTPAFTTELATERDADTSAISFTDVAVFLGDTAAQAQDRAEGFDAGEITTFAGTATEFADAIEEWGRNIRVLPGVNTIDIARFAQDVAPELRRRGLHRDGYTEETLRGHLGLARPANRYAA